MKIRESKPADLSRVLKVEEQTFGDDEGPEIVSLVKELLSDPSALPLLSLLAEDNGHATGHLLFIKARIANYIDSVSEVILAPLANRTSNDETDLYSRREHRRQSSAA